MKTFLPIVGDYEYLGMFVAERIAKSEATAWATGWKIYMGNNTRQNKIMKWRYLRSSNQWLVRKEDTFLWLPKRHLKSLAGIIMTSAWNCSAWSKERRYWLKFLLYSRTLRQGTVSHSPKVNKTATNKFELIVILTFAANNKAAADG